MNPKLRFNCIHAHGFIGTGKKILYSMPKATVHRTKPSRVDYNDLDVICHIEEACEAIRTGQSPNFKAASLEFGISYGTLRNRYYSLHQPSKQAHLKQQLLDTAQEETLVDWMIFLGKIGRPVCQATMRPKCIELCGRLPGRSWIWRFLKRHPEIKLRKPSGLDPK